MHGLNFHVCSQTGDQERYFHEQFLFKEVPGRLLQNSLPEKAGKEAHRPPRWAERDTGPHSDQVTKGHSALKGNSSRIPGVWDQLDPGWKETSRHLGEGREQAGETNPQISMLFEPKIMALDSLLQFEDAFK